MSKDKSISVANLPEEFTIGRKNRRTLLPGQVEYEAEMDTQSNRCRGPQACENRQYEENCIACRICVKEVNEALSQAAKELDHFDKSAPIVAMNSNSPDLDALVSLAKDCLTALDKFSQPPHYFIQPALGIVKKHLDIINKLKLMEE